MKKTIYERALELLRPEEISHHESDLYLKKNHISEMLVDECAFSKSISVFISQTDKQIWYDIPFGYDPFWNEKNTKERNQKIDRMKEYFVTSICKEDLLNAGFTENEINILNEGDMEEIARKLENDYLEQTFWQSLEIIARHVYQRKINERTGFA